MDSFSKRLSFLYLLGMKNAFSYFQHRKQTTIRKIPHRDLNQTAEYMRELAWEGQTSPLVREFAINALRRVKPKDALSEVGCSLLCLL